MADSLHNSANWSNVNSTGQIPWGYQGVGTLQNKRLFFLNLVFEPPSMNNATYSAITYWAVPSLMTVILTIRPVKAPGLTADFVFNMRWDHAWTTKWHWSVILCCFSLLSPLLAEKTSNDVTIRVTCGSPDVNISILLALCPVLWCWEKIWANSPLIRGVAPHGEHTCNQANSTIWVWNTTDKMFLRPNLPNLKNN
jgi:hypothetical protein